MVNANDVLSAAFFKRRLSEYFLEALVVLNELGEGTLEDLRTDFERTEHGHHLLIQHLNRSLPSAIESFDDIVHLS